MTRTVEDMYLNTVGSANPNSKRSLLLPTHSAAASATVRITHAQLRHLVCCPSQRGIVYYVGGKNICERDVLNPALPPRVIIDTDFSPTCFAAVSVSENPTTILFAAGGYNSELHLSLHAFPPSSHTPSSSTTPSPAPPKLLWRHSQRLRGRYEIVNSIVFAQASLTDDTRRAPMDFRIVIGGNDMVVKMFEVSLRRNAEDDQRLQECGSVKLETPVNHMSFSPDGRTLLCVGDTPKVYLFKISPGSTVTFSPLAVYTLPPAPLRPAPAFTPPSPNSPPEDFGSQACFSTAWSADGLKFAVASQEGQLCVWDVRSARPLLTFWTPFRRNTSVSAGGRWEWEDLGRHMRAQGDDVTNNGPDSGIRNVRFSAGEGGRELLVFVEHTFNVHVMDARTLDLASHSVVQFPELSASMPSLLPTEPQAPSPVGGVMMRMPSPAPSPIIIQRNRSHSRERRREIPTFGDPSMSRSRSRSRSRSLRGGDYPIRVHSVTPPFEFVRRRSRERQDRMVIISNRPRSRSQTRSPLEPAVIAANRSRSRTPPSMLIIQRPRSRSRSQESIGNSDFYLRRYHESVAQGVSLDMASSPQVIGGRRSPPPLTDPGYWPPSRRRGRVRLDADGDVIEDAEMSPTIPNAEVLYERAAQAQMERERERSEGLEAVSEGGEPPPPQRPTHIAGMCLDPSGGWVYVASESGIVEWRVREREEGKTCWGSGAWA